MEVLVVNKGGFSWKTLLGITNAKRQFARQTGIPTTKSGVERKVGRMVLDFLLGTKKRRWRSMTEELFG